jgi:RND family efflux transporter MFP subunit
LDAALAAQSTSSPGTGRHTSTPTAQPTSGNGSAQPSGSGNSSPNGGNGTTVTAAQIAADTAAVDAAQAQLAVAKQAVGEATLTSPISGTVGAVAVTAGQTVAASSSTATISIVGAGTMSVDVDIALAEIDLVKVGETAQVTVDGRSAPFSGHVTYVGGTNTASSTGSSATYAVTVTLDTADARLFDGMGTHVAIVTGVAHDVLSVPISAMHEFGSLTTVDVLRNGRETSTRVTLGVRGDARVEIRSGLAAGDRVVLADMSAAVPSSSSNNSPFGRRSSLGGLSGGGGPVFVGPVGGR